MWSSGDPGISLDEAVHAQLRHGRLEVNNTETGTIGKCTATQHSLTHGTTIRILSPSSDHSRLHNISQQQKQQLQQQDMTLLNKQNNNNIPSDDAGLNATTPSASRSTSRQQRQRKNRPNPRRRALRHERRLLQTRIFPEASSRHQQIPPPPGTITQDRDFGDAVKDKPEGICRLTGGNLAGFEVDAINNSKAEQLRTFLRYFQSDVHCGQEPNVNPKKMPKGWSLRSWLRNNRPLVTTHGYNTHGSHGKRLWGGAFVAAIDQTVDYVAETGKDNSGLGRWAWVKFLGKEGHVARIISAYRPNRCSDRTKHDTVFNQQRAHWATVNDRKDKCPLQLFDEDLQQLLLAWRQKGDKIVVFIDGNSSMQQAKMKNLFQHPDLQMTEAVSSRHPQQVEIPTCRRGLEPGRHQIDGVWTTPDIPIQKATFLAFDKAPGDHRHAVLDIKWTDLLGEPRLKAARPQARRLITSNTKAVSKYLKIARKLLRQHRILPRLQKLYRTANRGGLSPQQQQQLEALDNQKTEILRHAEKKCRQLCMGEIDFSPALEQARKLRALWHLVWKRKTGRKVSLQYIRKLARSLQVRTPLSCTEQEAATRRHKAAETYALLKPHGGMYRSDWLRERKQDTGLSETARKQATAQLRNEDIREDARKVRAVLGKITGGSVYRVEVQDEEGNYSTKTEQAEVEHFIMENNEKRFRLTESTPMLQQPLREELGLLAATQAAKQILRGTYKCPPQTDSYTRWFIECMRQSQEQAAFDTNITSKDFVNYWKRAKESTSSSVSGLHFGHYKAAAQCPLLSEIHALTCQLAYGTGYSLTRWQAGLSVMLEKEKGVIKVDKLRAILLMEADFNFANKLIFGSRMVRGAIQRGELPVECYGSIPEHEAIEVALNRRLILDISRQRRLPMAIASVDAHTCYDRISHTVASLCCQRWNVPLAPLVSMFSTIQRMKFHVRTGFGDSDAFYGGVPTDGALPFQGVCQGNGGGPAIWLAVSTALVLLLKKWGHQTTIRSSITQVATSFVGLLFVDDTDLIQYAKNPYEPVRDLVTRTSEAVNCWRGGLLASGGDLKPSKTKWCLVAYHFDTNGKFGYNTSASLPAALQVGDLEDGGFIVERVEPSTAIKAVGVYQAADGNMVEQLKDLKERANKWGHAIHAGWLPRALAWQAMRRHIWPSLKYPLPATNFTETEGYEITQQFYQAALPSMGTCRSFPRDMLFAPLSFQGQGLPHPFVEQGIEGLRHFMTHASSGTMTGHLLRSSLEDLQVELGRTDPVFEQSFADMGPLATDSRIKSLWEFTSKIKEIHLASDESPGFRKGTALQRENDALIMDLIMGSTLFSKRERQGVNRCRLYYQALTLADVTSGDGKSICGSAIRLDRNRYVTSSYNFQREQPGDEDKRAWAKAMAFLRDEGRDRPPLGSWIKRPHRTPAFVYDRETNCLFQRGPRQAWYRWRPSNRTVTRRGSFFYCDGFGFSPPQRACLATATRSNDRSRLQFGGYAGMETNPTPQPVSLQEFIQDLHNPWALRLSKFPEQGAFIAAAIRSGTCHGVTDGSYMQYKAWNMGSAAWILEDSVHQARLRCRGVIQTTGTDNEVTAYRSELQGLHTLLLAVLIVCRTHRVAEGTVTLGCDNETTVYLSQPDSTRVPYVHKNVDLLRAIRTLKERIPVKVVLRHVFGHQDDMKNYSELDRLSQLNVQMDTEAKRYLRHLIRHNFGPTKHHSMEGEGWRCVIRGRKITANLTEPLRRGYYYQSTKDYLHGRGFLSSTAFDLVDWDAMYEATSTFPELFRMWMSKHITGWCGTKTNLYHWGESDTDKCPCCTNGPRETPRHLLVCPSPALRLTWESRLDGFAQWMEEADTSPAIQRCFMEALRDTHGSHSFSAAGDFTTEAAARDQDHIGWLATMEGRISTRWKFTQESYWVEMGASRSIRKWSRDLVTNLLEISHSMWICRNEQHVHQMHKNGLPLQEGLNLERAIRKTYADGAGQVMPLDRCQFEIPLETMLDYPHFRQETWLNQVNVSRDELRLQQRGTGRELLQHSLHTFFTD